jgi:uncharacterized membrane protein YqjE
MVQQEGTAADLPAGPVSRLIGSIRGLMATVLAIGRTRLELLTVEVQLEIRRIADIVVLALVAVWAAGAGLLMAGFSIVLVFWNSHRVLAAILVSLGFLLAATAAAWMALRRVRAAPAFLAGTLRELSRDVEQLRGQR